MASRRWTAMSRDRPRRRASTIIARGRRATLLAAATCAALPSAALATSSAPLSGTAIIAKLNAERSRLGLFAGVTEMPEWSAKCALHNRWMQLNHRLQHPEIRGTPGYSEGGHWAGTHAVLGGPDGWRVGNPWRNAPIHLSQVYDPLLRRLGTSDDFRHSCMTTWPGFDLSAVMFPFGTPQNDHVFTLPADGGTAPFGQRASEVPFTPQEKVGLRRMQKTGPYLSFWAYTDMWHYADGERVVGHDEETGEPIVVPAPEGLRPLERIVSGSVIGPGGRPVPIKVIGPEKVELADDGTGWLLPIRPLKRATTYRATIVLSTGPGTAYWANAPERQISHSWTFKTDSRALGYTPARCRDLSCRPWTLLPRT
jgi:hypothetical protein